MSTTVDPPSKRNSIIFGASFIFGVLLWLGFPHLVGLEPFDAAAYPVVLFVGGLLLGLANPRRGWLLASGILLGNLAGFGIYAASTPSPFGWAIGAVQVSLACLWALGGAVLPLIYRALRNSAS